VKKCEKGAELGEDWIGKGLSLGNS
jgi:hypothetical protein